MDIMSLIEQAERDNGHTMRVHNLVEYPVKISVVHDGSAYVEFNVDSMEEAEQWAYQYMDDDFRAGDLRSALVENHVFTLNYHDGATCVITIRPAN